MPIKISMFSYSFFKQENMIFFKIYLFKNWGEGKGKWEEGHNVGNRTLINKVGVQVTNQLNY